MADEAAIRERARVVHLEPPVGGLEEPMWRAEDPETGCAGFGHVEAEAVGNLIAAVAEYPESGTPYAKVPGELIERRWE